MTGPERDAYFCDVCEDDMKRCNKVDCPGAPHPDDPHTQALEKAGERPNPWRPIETAPQGYKSLGEPSEWFLARPAKKSIGPKGHPPAYVVQRVYGIGFGPWVCTGDAFYKADFFDAWQPLDEHYPDTRVTELLKANNREVERRRMAQAAVAALIKDSQLVLDCLYAAEAEGLRDVIANSNDEQLVDLLNRRVLYHHADLQTTVSTVMETKI